LAEKDFASALKEVDIRAATFSPAIITISLIFLINKLQGAGIAQSV
jgi:hypothetical protein